MCKMDEFEESSFPLFLIKSKKIKMDKKYQTNHWMITKKQWEKKAMNPIAQE